MATTVLPYIVVILLLAGIWYVRRFSLVKSRRHYQQQQKKLEQSQQLLEQLTAENHRLLAEKDWLIKEVHHRVRNNLQTVISLLRMQARYLEDEQVLNAFHDISLRMQAIALTHQKLYQEKDNIAVISMPQYIYQLVALLEEKIGNRINIFFELDIDPIELAMSQSIPVGLILNEAITNAIKYAFTDRVSGRVRIAMKQDQEGIIVLSIADNGQGLPAGFDLDSCSSMGLKLVRMLTQQLDGKLFLLNDRGLLVSVHFAAEPETTGIPGS